jgi:hypothetical protein
MGTKWVKNGEFQRREILIIKGLAKNKFFLE